MSTDVPRRRLRDRFYDQLDTFSQYRFYKPIDSSRREIRVLVVGPGERDSKDIVRCRLKQLFIPQEHAQREPTAAERYETISYCWGDAKIRAKIRIDGHIADVPKSSEMALRCMRSPDRKRTLWIDAVCINQSDMEERSGQVAIMADVYRNGTRNLVYLGEADECTEPALRDIDLLLETEVAAATQDGRSLTDTVYANNMFTSAKTGLTVDIDQVSLERFYSRPWFRRLWIVQEVARSRESICHCGKSTFDMVKVLMAAQFLNHKALHIGSTLVNAIIPASSMFDFADEAHSVWRSGQGQVHLFHLLSIAADFQCTEPLDRVFAILGLMDWDTRGGIPEGLRPNYNKTLQEVLTSASYIASPTDSPLCMLDWISHRSRADIHFDGLPSWVPRWHRRWENGKDAMGLSRHNDASRGIDGPMSEALIPQGPDVFGMLSVPGYVIDHVQQAKPDVELRRFKWDSFIDEYFRPLKEVMDQGGYDADSIYHTMTAGAWLDDRPLTRQQLDECEKFCSRLAHGAPLPPRLDQVPDAANAETKLRSQCRQTIHNRCAQRLVCKTDRHLMSLVPGITEPGDVLVLLFGLEKPCVLRPCGDVFEFIGTCYIYGMMHGEAVIEWREKREPTQTFNLR